MNWVNSTIGDVLSVIQNGINCKQAKDGIGDKISRIETISDAIVNFNKVGYAVLSESEKHKAKLHKNDILFSHINSAIHVGKTALFAEEETLYHGINLLRLRVNGNVDSRFFNYFLNRLFWSGYWKKTAKQSVNQASVNQTDIKVVPFSYPPIPEQQRIVAILDQAFADIEKARANAEKNLKNARELFDSYLNQVFSQRGEGWVERPLGELFDVRDGTHDSPSYQESGFPLVTSKNLINGQISLEKVKYISATDFEKINKRSKVDIGDVLLAMIGTIGNPVVVTQEPSYAIKNVALIKGMPSQNSSFLKYFLESPFTVTKMLAEAKGTTQKFVGLGYLRDFPFYAPSIAEQKSIVDSLDKLSEKVQQLEKRYQEKLNSLDELKKSLLQKAFSGELTKAEGHAA